VVEREESIFCPECGQRITEEMTVCPGCGAELEWVEETEIEVEGPTFLCPECGQRITEGMTVCPGCGAELEFKYEEERLPEERRRRPLLGINWESKRKQPSTVLPEAEEIPAEEIEGGGGEERERGAVAEIEIIERRLSPDEVERLFSEAIEEMGDPYEVKNPTTEYKDTVVAIREKWELASRIAAGTEKADRLLDSILIMGRKREFSAAIRLARNTIEDLDRDIENAFFYTMFEVSDASSHLASGPALRIRKLVDEAAKYQAGGEMKKAVDTILMAVEAVEEESPGFKSSREKCCRLSRSVALAERFLVDTRPARGLMIHASDYAGRGDWLSAEELYDSALENLIPLIYGVAKRELEGLKPVLVKLRIGGANDLLMASVSDAMDFLSKDEPLPALEHIFRIKKEIVREQQSF